jgi:hypothetical protein
MSLRALSAADLSVVTRLFDLCCLCLRCVPQSGLPAKEPPTEDSKGSFQVNTLTLLNALITR